MDSWTDSELVLAARSGNKAAFGILIERYEGMVSRLAWRMVGDAELAHDLTQDALLQAYLSLDSLRLERSFKSWLYGITLNVCRMYLRTERSNVYSLDVLVGGAYRDLLDQSPTPEEIAEGSELRRTVMNAVEALSPANRAAVLLCYYEDFSLGDGAEMLGISVTAFKGRLHKARRQLEASLLSVHPAVAVKRGVTRMIPVKIVDVISKPNTRGEEKSPANQVILLDEAGNRAIVIWVGAAEGQAIAFGMRGYDFGRPIMPTFVSRLLQATGSRLESVEISALKNDVYYATVRLRASDATHEVDARPSDALALAVQVNTPIFVSEEVMEKSGKQLPKGATPTGQGIKDIISQSDGQIQRLRLEMSDDLCYERVKVLKRQYDQKTEEVLLEAFASQ